MTRGSRENLPYRLFVGTHSAASRITAAWMPPDGKPGMPVTFDPTPVGFETLQQHLGATGIAPAHTLVVPHTSHPAWLDLAGTLTRAGYAISPISTARARTLATTLLQVGSNDTIDASTLARLAALLRPTPWSPSASTAAEVQRLLDEHATLVGVLQRLEQQRSSANPCHLDALHTGLHTQLRDLEQRLVGLMSNDNAWAAAAQHLTQFSDAGLMAALWQTMTTRTPQSFDLLRSASRRYLPKNPHRALLHFSRPFAIASLALALTAGPVLPAALAQEGGGLDSPQAISTIRVNDTVDGDQYRSAVARDDSGNITVIAWDSDATSGDEGIYIKGLDSTGATLFGETLVFTDTTSIEGSKPDVAMDSDGDFVVVWREYDASNYGSAIVAQRYTSAGSPTGTPITIAQETSLQDDVDDPAVAVDLDGDFVVAWHENYYGSPNYYDQIFAVRYNSAGVLQGSLIAVDTVANANNEAVSSPDVGMDDDGDFVVVWDESYSIYDTVTYSYTYYYSIYAQRYTAAGTTSGSRLNLDTSTTAAPASPADISYVKNPAVDMNSTGTFAAAWEEFNVPDQSYYLIYTAYNTSGTQTVDENIPVPISFGNAENAAVTIDDTGNVVAVAESLTTGGDQIIFYEDPTTVGSPQFAIQTPNTANHPAVDADSTGDFIITWDGYYNSSATQEVLAGEFDTASSTAPVVTATNSTLSYTAGTGAVAIDSSIGLSDPDSANLEGATIEITSGFESTEDELGLPASLPSGITPDTSVAGTITLAGTAPISDYQSVLSQITYENTAATPTVGTRTVTFTVDDGTDTGSDTRDINVAGANVAPTVTTTGNPLAYTENDSATPIDPNIAVSDTGDLTSATVEITGGFNSTEDELGLPASLPVGITADTSVADIITLSGAASATDYQTALSGITYTNTSDDPDITTRTVTFTVSDGSESDNATRDIAITAENDAPAVTTTSNSLGYLPGAGVVAIDQNITVDDLDDTNLVSATVEITGGFDSTEDELGLPASLPSSITPDTSVTGTITLTGTATITDYETVLSQITYENTAATPTQGTRTVTFTVYDPDNAQGSDTRDITVGTQNDAPTVTASAGALAYTEGQSPQLIDLTITVNDPDDTNLEGATIEITGGFVDTEDTLSVASALPSSINPDTSVAGTITLTGTASVGDYEIALRKIAYENTSDNPDTTTRTVTFTVDDGTDTGSDTRDIEITAENDAPTVTNTATALTYTTDNGQVIIDPGILVDDVDNTNLMTATVEISGGFVSTEDMLDIQGNLPGSITADTSVTGTITLTGTAPISDYQSVLSQITYENTADPLTEGTRTVTFTVYDPEGAESSDVRLIEVTRLYKAYLPFAAK